MQDLPVQVLWHFFVVREVDVAETDAEARDKAIHGMLGVGLSRLFDAAVLALLTHRALLK